MELFFICAAGFVVGLIVGTRLFNRYNPEQTRGRVYIIEIENEQPYLYLDLYGEVEDLYELESARFDISHK